MNSCEVPTKDMFPFGIQVCLEPDSLDFESAYQAAMDAASCSVCDPMLVSWFEKKTGKYSPGDVSCCRDGKPSWVSYAESRGGHFAVDVNDEDYVFMFRDNCCDC